MHIGQAVAEMRAGRLVRRAGWNGKDLTLAMQVPDAQSKMTLPYAYLTTAKGEMVPWTCSQSDLFADDWEVC